jgi:phosphate transport system permease protein
MISPQNPSPAGSGELSRPGIATRAKPGRSVARRRLTGYVAWGLAGLALILVSAPVISIVGAVMVRGVSEWNWSILTTTSTGTHGGLENAIVGTLVIVASVVAVAGTLGIAGGIYLAEFCPARLTPYLRGASEVLSGVPSIVLGYVGYTTLVVEFHWGFSLAAATLVLSVLVVPYVVKSTEVALLQVPTSYREGAVALGFSDRHVLAKAVLRPALPGIATGLIVAVAIALGETAPLLYTAGWSDNLPTTHLLHAPLGYLPYAVYTFYNEPYRTARVLSHEAAFLLILLVLALILLSRLVVARTQKHTSSHGSGAH